MMLAGAVGRRPVGLHPGHPQGAARGQRDHHHPDAQLHRPVRGSSSGSSGRGARAASSRPSRSRREAWLPRLTDFAAHVPGPRRADRPPRAHLRDRRRGDHVGRPRADPLGLRDPAHRRQPARPRATPASTSAARSSSSSSSRARWPGWAGMSEVAGVVHRLQDHISPGYGFTAIIIAYLARFGPFRVVVASILFGALILAGREIQPSGVPAMIQGIILFCAHRQRRPDPLPGPLRPPAGDRLMDLDHDPRGRASRAARSCCSRRSARSSPSGRASSTSASRG